MRRVLAALVAASTLSNVCVAHATELPDWPLCQYEDGNPNGQPCIWVHEGRAYYNDGSNYED